jgi:hypothetical protein
MHPDGCSYIDDLGASDTLAIRSFTGSPTGDSDQVETISWPSLASRHYLPGYPLGPLAPAYDGSSIYWFGSKDGKEGVWQLQDGGASRFVGSVGVTSTLSLMPLTDGLVWSESEANAAAVTVKRMNWDGSTQTLIGPLPAVESWLDGAGEWMVFMGIDGYGSTTFLVEHAGQSDKIAIGTSADLIGMTADRSGVVYRARSNNEQTILELHVLTLSDHHDRVIDITSSTGGRVGAVALSPGGILAYHAGTGAGGRVCLLRLPVGLGPKSP